MNTPDVPQPPGATRREFGKTLALLTAAPLATALAHGRADDDEKDKAPPADAIAEALTEIVRIRHGKHLTDEQRKAIARSIAGSQRGAEAMRRFKLSNADEPAFAFRADLP